MRTLTTLSLLFFFSATVFAEEPKPKLAVVIVIDQLRGDSMERFTSQGLGRFIRDGAYFKNARHGHVPTFTEVGHASIATGRFPKSHGIIGEEFFDRKKNKRVLTIEDKDLGTGPFRLNSPTLGDLLKEDSEASTVVSIAGKVEAAVLQGGKKADLAMWYDKKTGRFITSSYYGKLPNWADDWNAENEVIEKRRKSIRKHPHLDQLTLSLVRRAIEALDLGADDVADLLMVSLSATDLIGHTWGPFSDEMSDQLKRLDRELGSFLDFLDYKIGSDDYVVVLTGDHGVLPLPRSPKGDAIGARRVISKDLRAALESDLKAELGKPKKGEDWVVAWNPPHVNLNIASLKRRERKRIIGRAAALLTAREEIVWAQPARSIPGSREFSKIYLRSLPKNRAGDVVFLWKRGVLLTEYAGGTGHGSPYDYDTHVPIALLGAGVLAGRYPRAALTVEIAPTLARILGVKLKGKLLKEALSR